MSVFNLEEQNSRLDYKIVAGLERLSQVFRVLLWEKAKLYNLSPIQIQLLIFIKHHASTKSTVSHLAQEFNVTKPTISDAIKVLEQKKMLRKFPDTTDSRSYTMQLTDQGQKVVLDTEDFATPLTQWVTPLQETDKTILWEHLSQLILHLNRSEIISVQRTCSNCSHYSCQGKRHYCSLLQQTLYTRDIRLDCSEFKSLSVS